MKRILGTALAVTALFACNTNTGSDKTTDSKTTHSGDLYFDYTIDGKEMHVDAADIMSTYRANNTDTVFTIHAGKEDGTTLLLTIPHDMTNPSTTPSGSPDLKMNISQGSASLQNYPEKNYTSNSFNGTYPEKSPVITDAIVVTTTEARGEEGRIITGTFNIKTYSDNKETDPKNTDHVIKGKFRIKHEFSSINGGKF
ncbi:MAG: hypothetical protein SGI83_05645 [Bacteroidota bacterium]|nr:hypothetical protein [Bacteroidota bacterium]